ncbi:MAG: ubiquinone/menaquinone biosynthesis methyltransferase [Candidatus Methanofastidiosum methylothiophilum]|uniref:Ubiquinone/menaquinone biosynthesis methyltransferase n=1 Tax=Candidatus Methanofastidiosum methylothiophilum TaxID=1705564 RepID=A0A150IK30_9EURY|nr:MAG: ubiquinone/menaquinone biosynthesis methyltransferase [Candidatus Methanofastidiosum methylthiophilus]KYC47505.1 MAG: ubiquinone/menaquinone biosynthesis methyltransferase [Candidatus Methanofastidiosum methylthiophilus]KYC50405.1 MAG: ubiquinone/menaquinone biosynthesis methyltransferase [Candidatus Methanofastidiosum methylthiophilus]
MGSHEDKKHWYDGKLYNYFIDPATEETRRIISSLIEDNSNVIDIGCGTGSLALFLSKKCNNVLGLELSKKMVSYANSIKQERKIINVHFLHGTAENVSQLTNERFDYAIFSLSLHEMKSETRIKALEEIKKIANSIIIYDYLVKKNTSFKGVLNSTIEFLAGKDHFENYKSFQKENGIFGLLEKNGFMVEKIIIDKDTYAAVKAKLK